MNNLTIAISQLEPNINEHDICAPRFDCITGDCVQKNYYWHYNRRIIKYALTFFLDYNIFLAFKKMQN